MVFCIKIAYITRPFRTCFMKFMSTVLQNVKEQLKKISWSIDCKTFATNAGTSGALYCLIMSCLLPSPISLEPNPWCVFFPSKVARSWYVLSPTYCKKIVSYEQIISTVTSWLTYILSVLDGLTHISEWKKYKIRDVVHVNSKSFCSY